MTTLLAYTDTDSVAPGDTISVMVACRGADAYDAHSQDGEDDDIRWDAERVCAGLVHLGECTTMIWGHGRAGQVVRGPRSRGPHRLRPQALVCVWGKPVP